MPTTVEGYIHKPDGTPAAGTPVTFRPWPSAIAGHTDYTTLPTEVTAVTDEDGLISTQLESGYYIVQIINFSANAYVPNDSSVLLEDIWLTDGPMPAPYPPEPLPYIPPRTDWDKYGADADGQYVFDFDEITLTNGMCVEFIAYMDVQGVQSMARFFVHAMLDDNIHTEWVTPDTAPATIQTALDNGMPRLEIDLGASSQVRVLARLYGASTFN